MSNSFFTMYKEVNNIKPSLNNKHSSNSVKKNKLSTEKNLLFINL